MDTATARSAAAQYVTLGVGDEIFAVDVAQVREVLTVCPATRIPNAPSYMRGIIDVRGKSVPVIDMRARFGLPAAEDTHHTRIVVLEVEIAGRRRTVGALTDRVFEVATLEQDAIEPPPEVGERWGSEFIRGVAHRGDSFVVILDVDRLLDSGQVPLDALT